MAKEPLSVVYISKNSERYLHDSLKSIQYLADEILVVDCGSKDQTVAIAQAVGARVLLQEWLGFAAQRQFAVMAATHEWILMLDTDEILRPTAEGAIRAAIQAGQADAFALRRQNYIGSKAVRYSEWRNDWVIRLFDRRLGRYDPSVVVHESWQSVGRVSRIRGVSIDHYPFASVSEMLPKLQRYAELNAAKVYARKRPVSTWAPMNHALGAFLRSYVLRLGILDGVEGAAIAWTTALGAFMKYAIARERQLREGDGQ